MLNPLFYNVAIELQNIGLKTVYQESSDGRPYRSFLIEYEGIGEIKVYPDTDEDCYKIKPGMVRYSLGGTFSDKWGRDHYVYDTDEFSINISSKKPPQQIAAEIKRRLLNNVNLKKIRKTLESIAGYEKRTEEKIALLKGVAEIAGHDALEINSKTQEIPCSESKLPKVINRIQTHYDRGLRLELHDVTLEQFKRICEALS